MITWSELKRAAQQAHAPSSSRGATRSATGSRSRGPWCRTATRRLFPQACVNRGSFPRAFTPHTFRAFTPLSPSILRAFTPHLHVVRQVEDLQVVGATTPVDKSTRIKPAPEQDNYGSPARQKFSVAAGEGGSAKIQSGHAQGVAGGHPQGVGAGGEGQATDVTFKKAQRVRPNPSEKQKILPIEGEPPEED